MKNIEKTQQKPVKVVKIKTEKARAHMQAFMQMRELVFEA